MGKFREFVSLSNDCCECAGFQIDVVMDRNEQIDWIEKAALDESVELIDEIQGAILEGYTDTSNVWKCDHEWEPNTTMNFMRCEHCYIGLKGWKALSKIKEFKEKCK